MTVKKLREGLLSLVPGDGTTIGNTRVRQTLGKKVGREVDEASYEPMRDALDEEGVLAKGQGRGDSVRFADVDEGDFLDDAPHALILESPEPKAPTPKKTPPKKTFPGAERGRSHGPVDSAQLSSERPASLRRGV